MFNPDTTTRFEVVVRYNNNETATFSYEDDFEAAMGKATSLGRLNTAREVWVNELTVQQVYHHTNT